ncbi:[acyl-carrier-protein] S-malonyltransferase [Micrococcales bacterium KH10]|nr:[acyl-carrier-protein] S-malonyltransferase [Micrococcales bacterium KH10]
MLALLSPGQGSQTPGMLSPWLEIPGVAEQIAEFSDAAKLDLVAHGTQSDADTIRDTAIAQPLIVASSLIAARALLGDRAATDVAGVTAGHSVGEFAAAAIAGALSDASAVSLVGMRARAMARAAAITPSGMSAVVGGDPDEVLAAIEEVGLTAANVNGGGQVVAAGSLEALAQLAENPPAKARVIPLQVAGAFHTDYMASARDEFRAVTATWTAQSPALPLLSNADGAVLDTATTGDEVLSRLVNQVASPVRWDLCQQTLQERGTSALIELLPGGVLTGLARRTLTGVPAVAMKSPDDLDKARQLIDEHLATGTGEGA